MFVVILFIVWDRAKFEEVDNGTTVVTQRYLDSRGDVPIGENGSVKFCEWIPAVLGRSRNRGATPTRHCSDTGSRHYTISPQMPILTLVAKHPTDTFNWMETLIKQFDEYNGRAYLDETLGKFWNAS